MVCLDGIKFFGVWDNLCFYFFLYFLSQVKVPKPQNKPNNVYDPHDWPYEKGLDENFCDRVDFLLVKTENIVYESLCAWISEHFLDPDACWK